MRFNHAWRESQKAFVDGAYHFLEREKVASIFIQVDWGSEKQRNIVAMRELSPSKLYFNLP